MPHASYILLLCLLIKLNVYSQGKDITPYVITKGNFIERLNRDFWDWDDPIIRTPDKVKGIKIRAIEIVCPEYPIKEVYFSQNLRYVAFNFDRTQIKTITLPKNLYYLLCSGGGERQSFNNIKLPTPHKKDHCFIGWNDTIPGESYVANFDQYIASFKYLKDSTYTISEEDVIFYDGIIHKCFYRGAKNIIIPDSIDGKKVIAMLSMPFAEMGIESVVFEKGITKIGGFYKNNIKHLDLHEGVTEISSNAFQYNQITELKIPSTVKKIGDDAFRNNLISNINLPQQISYLSGFANNKLTEIEMPISVDTIGNMAFPFNELKMVKIPNRTTTIGNYAFYKNKITSIFLPSSIEKLGFSAFEGNQLSEIILPQHLKKIEARCFASNNLAQISFPPNVIFIGESAFANNPFFKSPPRLPKPQIAGKHFLFWKGETISKFGKTIEFKYFNPGEIINDYIRYTAVFDGEGK